MEYLFKNQAKGTLEGNIGTGDTTLNLETGDGALFPSPGTGEGFHIVVTEGANVEWMVCTARSSDAFTVTRGASPIAFNDGALVEHRLHEDALTAFMQKGDFRTVTTDPDGSLAAAYSGEEVYQSVSGVWWKHCVSTTWKEMNL